MSKSNAWENSVLLHLFQNADVANIGDATGIRGSSTAGSLYVALHTGDPGEGGTQATNEATFGSYARQAVARSSGGWTVSGDTASNAAAITFPTGSSGSETITHFSIGVAVSGSTVMLYSAALGTSRAAGTGITLSFAIGALTVVEG